jgi:hypothetical protein
LGGDAAVDGAVDRHVLDLEAVETVRASRRGASGVVTGSGRRSAKRRLAGGHQR